MNKRQIKKQLQQDNKKKNYSSSLFKDMSYRDSIDFYTPISYSDEELQELIIEIEKQIDKLESIKNEYYSINTHMERISNRTFIDILMEKMKTRKNSRLSNSDR